MSYPEPMGRVRLLCRVQSEDPVVLAGLGLSAAPETYPFTMNANGAVSIILSDGRLLGVKPSEFEWVKINAALTLRQRVAIYDGPQPR